MIRLQSRYFVRLATAKNTNTATKPVIKDTSNTLKFQEQKVPTLFKEISSHSTKYPFQITQEAADKFFYENAVGITANSKWKDFMNQIKRMLFASPLRMATSKSMVPFWRVNSQIHFAYQPVNASADIKSSTCQLTHYKCGNSKLNDVPEDLVGITPPTIASTAETGSNTKVIPFDMVPIPSKDRQNAENEFGRIYGHNLRSALLEIEANISNTKDEKAMQVAVRNVERTECLPVHLPFYVYHCRSGMIHYDIYVSGWKDNNSGEPVMIQSVRPFSIFTTTILSSLVSGIVAASAQQLTTGTVEWSTELMAATAFVTLIPPATAWWTNKRQKSFCFQLASERMKQASKPIDKDQLSSLVFASSKRTADNDVSRLEELVHAKSLADLTVRLPCSLQQRRTAVDRLQRLITDWDNYCQSNSCK